MRGEWTPARFAILQDDYPTSTDTAALLAKINARPGHPIAGIRSLRMKAKQSGIRKTRETLAEIARLTVEQKLGKSPTWRGVPQPRPARAKKPYVPPAPPPMRLERVLPVFAAPEPVVIEDLTPAQQAAIADAAMAKRHAKARAMLAKRGADPHAVVKAAGLPLREVFRLQGEVRP